MNRFIPVSMLLGVAAIAGIAGTAQAQCVNNRGTFSLQRSAPPSDDTFATSGPVDSDSRFKFELELGGDLDFFSTDAAADATDEDAAMTSAADEPTDDMSATTSSETPVAGGETPTIFSLDADSSSAADLETVELGTQSLMSREEYLDSQAREINSCF